MIKQRLLNILRQQQQQHLQKRQLAFDLINYTDEQLKQDYVKQKSIERLWDAELMQKHRYLRLPQKEPDHLLIIDENKASAISNSIIKSLRTQTNTFVELHPGFGVVTKSLMQKQSQHALHKYYLFESRKEYMSYLQEIKRNHNNVRLFLDKNPFNTDKFQFPVEINDKLRNGPLAIFGILPWNHKLFLHTLFSYYANDLDIFMGENLPELFLILPEFLTAQLQPELPDKKFLTINTKLSVQSAAYCDVKILSTEAANDFFPYPLPSPKTKTKYKQLKSLDYTKMYLVHINFLPNDKLLVNNKQLFNQFLIQLWVNSNNMMKNSLSNLFHDLKPVQKPKFSLNRRIGSFHAFEFIEIYNVLCQDPSNLILKDKSFKK